MLHFIYKITHRESQKSYIGRTSNLKKRFKSHIKGERSSLIHRSIKKYGEGAFSFEIIDQDSDPEKIKILEFYYIQKFNSLSPKGYNLAYSVEGCAIQHEKTKNKLRLFAQGRRRSDSNKYIGVRERKYKNTKSFYVQISYKGNSYNKTFRNEDEAVEAYDKVALFLFGQKANLNFPERKNLYFSCDLKQFFQDFNSVKKCSEFLGVSFNSKRKEYTVMFKFQNQGIFLGAFLSEKKAAEIRDQAEIYFNTGRKLNFPEKREEFLCQQEDFVKFLKKRQDKCYTSVYRGVSLTNKSSRRKWRVSVVSRKHKIQKSFLTDSEIGAAELRDKIVVFYNLNQKLNFPEKKEEYLLFDIKEIQREPKPRKEKKIKNKQIGVVRYNKELFTTIVRGRNYGTFSSVEDAAYHRDLVATYFKIRSSLNYPENINEYQNTLSKEFDLKLLNKKENTSQHKGVCWVEKIKKWKAYDKKKHIGNFNTEIEAYEARQDYLKKQRQYNK